MLVSPDSRPPEHIHFKFSTGSSHSKQKMERKMAKYPYCHAINSNALFLPVSHGSLLKFKSLSVYPYLHIICSGKYLLTLLNLFLNYLLFTIQHGCSSAL